MSADNDSSSPASEPAPQSGAVSRCLMRLASWQLHHPWRLLTLAAVLVTLSLMLAARLEVRPGFDALLPDARPSVLELNRVKKHTVGVSTMFVVLEGDGSDDTTKALRRAADDITAACLKLGFPWVGSAESGVHEALRFMRPRAGLFAKLSDLEQLRDDVDERYEHEVGKATGASLGLDEDYEPPELNAADIRKRFGIDESEKDLYPDGYYQSKDGTAIVVALRSSILGTDYEKSTEAIAKVRNIIDRLNLKSYHPSIRYGMSGDLVTANSEYRAINDDLTDVGLLGAFLIISVVLLYYLRMRTLLSMLLTITIGVSCTFGLTELLVGNLNMATGFLFTIIAGNGINPGIIYMARYLEARRLGKGDAEAIFEAHRETWLPTLTASCAASAAYASLIVTEFRGFRDFGIIGGVGMVLCWLCTFTFLPPILVVAEKVSPLKLSQSGLFGLLPKATTGGTRFGVPFSALVSRFPRSLATIGCLTALVATVGTIGYIRADPMEYDLRNLRSDMSARAEEIRLTRMAEKLTGFVGLDGMAILTDRPEQVPLLVTELNRRRDEAPADKKPFKAVHTLQDFVPAEQAAKIPLLFAIKDKLLRSRKRGFISDDDFEKLNPYLPPDDLKPFAIDDVPEDMARAFTERDGRRGRIVYISPTDPKLVDDANYLFRWANAYRRTELPDESVIIGSGRAVIYADLWQAVLDDVPKAVFVSLLATLLVIAIAFRAGFAASIVMLALITGVVWMTGLLAIFGVKLNFLNFIALPITFGIGVDYAVNIMQRYRREGPGSALTAVRETGGAVILCSLTTTLGYFALVGSVNYAVRSLGIAAVLGEIACLFAAVLVLPGILVWRDQRRTGPRGKADKLVRST